MLAVIAPGQGAQKPGFLRPWLDLPGAEGLVRWWSAAAGTDLVHAGTDADADAIRDTALTQPLLVAAGLLAARQLDLDDAVLAGHSVGELTAAVLTGVLSPESGMILAGARGRAMARACTDSNTGMSAVLGGDPDAVLARLDELGLTPANRNGGGQVVAAGPLAALAELAADPPQRTRVVPLQVAGAFHTPTMEPAHRALAAMADAIGTGEPEHLMLSNADGTAMSNGAQTLTRLVDQVTAPVRWDLCQAALRDLGVTALIELPPAGTLAGLAKRELRGVEIVTVRTPEDLPAARELIARHAGPPSVEPSVGFRVAVAPAAGTFAPATLAEGSTVAAGTQVAQVMTRQGSTGITVGYDAVLTEWLATDGDPVAPGQPLVRLHPLTDGSVVDLTASEHTGAR